MKLYYSPGACSMAPHIALIEAGIKFDTEKVDLRTGKTSQGEDFAKINPKKYVPALQLDNGDLLTEAQVVLQFIADQKPEKHLLPPFGSMERYKTMEWLNYVATEIHEGFGPLWKPTTPEEYKTQVKQNLAGQFKFLDQHFSGNPYLMGKTYTVADMYLFTVLNWSHKLKVDLTPFTNVIGFMERVKNRDATQATLRAEGLLK